MPKVRDDDGGDHAADVDGGVEHGEVGCHLRGLLWHLQTTDVADLKE